MVSRLHRSYIDVTVPPESRRPALAEELFARYWERDDSGNKRTRRRTRTRAR